jgi:hypothetical protein
MKNLPGYSETNIFIWTETAVISIKKIHILYDQVLNIASHSRINSDWLKYKNHPLIILAEAIFKWSNGQKCTNKFLRRRLFHTLNIIWDYQILHHFLPLDHLNIASARMISGWFLAYFLHFAQINKIQYGNTLKRNSF